MHSPCAQAHDLEDNRATLILREPNHLSLTLYVRFSEAAYRALAGDQSYTTFLMTCAAMKPEQFRAQMLRAQRRLESTTRVVVNGSTQTPILNWQWPDVTQLQALMRQQVMDAVLGGAGHVHEPQIEIRADVLGKSAVRDARLLPAAGFGRILLVWYRPTQAWIEPGQPFPVARF